MIKEINYILNTDNTVTEITTINGDVSSVVVDLPSLGVENLKDYEDWVNSKQCGL